MKQRIEIPKDVAASILVASERTCCVCTEPGKEVQIHHVDEDPSNNDPANLAVLCFDCHDKTQIKGGFGRKLDAAQVLQFKTEWEQRVQDRKAKADEAVIAKLVGTAPEAQLLPAPEKRDRIPNEERLTNFIKLLPAMKKDVYSRSFVKWDQGYTWSQVEGCRDCIDVFRQMLVILCGWFPPNHFGKSGVEDFIDSFIAFSYKRHRATEEPRGYGTAGTMVRVLVAGAVMDDLNDFVGDVVRSLLWHMSSADPEEWRKKSGIDPDEWKSAWNSAEERAEK